ncbi:hypothetical protein ASPBRDRAFT_197752 [Aspergillus brasiliensis CBS 101740]|uniref:Uncharacterized protein n=1 Tax=Aspergillus brasiliensis (strain CBS 101740 / IMI 381727 / IBT 21946) TaxID=767769 RepID=A0A1L9UEG7_ASPBC|nr:hypothetical protein ASPBRDRAFT_197752 [Aspergillus brasiliensis CBS 101740]
MLQLQPLLPPNYFWPDGIPQCLRADPNPDIDYNDMEEMSKGWLQFVQEEWTKSESLEEEFQQRRRLMERWASADQTFRDSYQIRAPLPKNGVDYPPSLLIKSEHFPRKFVCLAPVDREQHATNYTRLVKLLILFYTSLHRGGNSHPMSFEPEPYPHIPVLFPDHPKYSPTLEALLPLYCLEYADFRFVSMTSTGTVFFPGLCEAVFTVIDQEALNTGQPAMLVFHMNGQIKDYSRLRPWHAGHIMSFHNVQGWPLEEMINLLDLSQPLVDIIDSAQQKREVDIRGYTRELLTEQLEVFAPGYLALERQGLEVQYDLANLLSGDIIHGYNYMIPSELYPPGDKRRKDGR